MGAIHTFFLAPEAWQAPFTLDGAEAHHLTRVLRIKPGRQVRLFDGQGLSGLFTVQECRKTSVILELVEQTFIARPGSGCTLAAGFSKALRRSWFLEKAVELEAKALWLWQGDHSQATLPDEEKLAWKGSLIAGAKQCANPWLPELVMFPQGLGGVVEGFARFDRVFFLYEGDTQGRLLQMADLAAPGNILMIIGPEGGFSGHEASLLVQAGALPVSLGPRILRWETAAVLALGLAWWAKQSPGGCQV